MKKNFVTAVLMTIVTTVLLGLIYPLVVITIAVGIVTMIMIFVIPKFEQIFKDFKVELPAVTQALER